MILHLDCVTVQAYDEAGIEISGAHTYILRVGDAAKKITAYDTLIDTPQGAKEVAIRLLDGLSDFIKANGVHKP